MSKDFDECIVINLYTVSLSLYVFSYFEEIESQCYNCTKHLRNLQRKGDIALPVGVASVHSKLKHSMMYKDHPYTFSDK